MVDAVLRFLKDTPPLQPQTVAAYLRYALLLLYRFSRRHAWNRTKRHREKLFASGISGLCSLEETQEQTGDLLMPGLPDRYPGLEFSRDQIVRILENLGHPPARIWSFVWHVVDGADWSEVKKLVETYFPCGATEERLRQWASRDLKRLLPRLRDILLGEQPPAAAATPTAKASQR